MVFGKRVPLPSSPATANSTLGSFGMKAGDDAAAFVGMAAIVIAGLLLSSPKARRGLFTIEDHFNLHKTLGP